MSRSAEVPVIAVVCDDPAHTEPFVVARFGKPPAGNWVQFGAVTGEDWLPLPWFYDASVNPERQRLSRADDLNLDGRYNLECQKCAPYSDRRITVTLRQELINKVCDGLNSVVRDMTGPEAADRCISVTLSLLAASV